MDSVTLIIVFTIALVVIVGLVLGFLLMRGAGGSGRGANAQLSDNLKNLVLAQRATNNMVSGERTKGKDSLAVAAAAESELTKKKSSTSKITLEKRLKFAHWAISPLQFRLIQGGVALAFFIPANMFLEWFWWILSPVMGFLICGAILDRGIQKRFEAFDEDYPVLLLSYVSLLKTGMTTIAGLDAAAKGLDEGSLVRAEVELMIERLKMGLTEEQAINSFGEDIAHPELELFVQCLLLSRKVGGQLSTTLERLAKQVRKRQEFRKKAVAAVGMERGSIWAIAGVMGLLLVYIAIQSPDLIFPAGKSPMGQQMWQGGILLIICGFYLIRQVTKIKV